MNKHVDLQKKLFHSYHIRSSIVLLSKCLSNRLG